MAKECGPTSNWSQRGTREIPNIEDAGDSGMRLFRALSVKAEIALGDALKYLRA